MSPSGGIQEGLMNYLITGGTGFIGKHLVRELLQRPRVGKVYLLVRKGSKQKFNILKAELGKPGEKLVAVTGDLTRKRLGIAPKMRQELDGAIDHVFHLAAVYDLEADIDAQWTANVDGTRNAVQLANEIGARRFHHMSSIAAAGLYPGVFREDMFEEAMELDHPYFRTKHDAEAVVRQECDIPWRVYRPGIVVGHSETGEMDKVDGPYYFFKGIQKMRSLLPSWMPTLGIEGSRINLVPVDYVAAATVHIAHKPKLDGRAFHLTEPKPRRIGEILNLFAEAAHAPKMTMRFDARMFSFVPASVRNAVSMLPPVRRIVNQVLGDLGLPRDILRFVNYPTRFDNRDAEEALKGSGIKVPRLEDYAWRLWDYWERHLDPDLFIDRSLKGHVGGEVVVVTGASSGIGKATALMMAEAGARVVLVARSEEGLKETQAHIEELGGEAHSYPCDLTDLDACDALIDDIVADLGGICVLVNNAGRSIRRSIAHSYDRFHDFERTMQLNYFGSLRLIMRCLPHMTAAGAGQFVNISSIGVLSNAPRFSAYVASKAALDAFSRCASSEFSDTGVAFTTVNMPLVRTPMIAPTKIYDHVPTISPEEAADMVRQAVIHRPQRIATRLGVFAQVLHAVAPKVSEIVMNSAFRMFPDSAGRKGVDAGQTRASQEQIAFASLMRGIHW